tara:strand:+ start:1491 stop:1823 length:333 start_codon:yes stop_codon:yes gene_type:complete
MVTSEDHWVEELKRNIMLNLHLKKGMYLKAQYVILTESGVEEEFFFEIDDGQVNVKHGKLDSPDIIFSLDRSVALSINAGELTTEEAFLKGLLKFDGDARKIIEIYSEIP